MRQGCGWIPHLCPPYTSSFCRLMRGRGVRHRCVGLAIGTTSVLDGCMSTGVAAGLAETAERWGCRNPSLMFGKQRTAIGAVSPTLWLKDGRGGLQAVFMINAEGFGSRRVSASSDRIGQTVATEEISRPRIRRDPGRPRRCVSASRLQVGWKSPHNIG